MAQLAGANKIKYEDFMPQKQASKTKPMDEQDILEHLRMINAAMGGKEIIT
jgi:hypothetical protein